MILNFKKLEFFKLEKIKFLNLTKKFQKEKTFKNTPFSDENYLF